MSKEKMLINRKQGFGKIVKKFWPLYLMMAPGLLYIIINNYIPMLGIAIAFKRINYGLGILKSPWVGFDNFKFLFKTADTWNVTRNTILYNLAFIILGTLMAITVAILLNEVKRVAWKKAYQTTILIPFLISTVVVSYLVFAFLSTENGFINNTVFQWLGKDRIQWYTAEKYWPFILIIVYLWKSFGYSCIMYYAMIIGIDRSYYEASVVDGASRWQQVKNITLPCLKGTIIILTLMSVGRIFYSDFGLFYQVPMNSGLLINVTNTIDTYVYRGLLQLNDTGRASAAGLYQSVVGFIVVLSANLLVRKVDKDNALF